MIKRSGDLAQMILNQSGYSNFEFKFEISWRSQRIKIALSASCCS
jgi:hypothetical protein